MGRLKAILVDLEAGEFDDETAELIEMAHYYELGDFAPLVETTPQWRKRLLDKISQSDRTPEDYGGYDD